MPEYTLDEIQDLILLARNAAWRYQLDQFEAEALRPILSSIRSARNEILAEIEARGAAVSQWTEDLSMALLDELDALTSGLQETLANNIADVAAYAGEASYLTHNNIVSFDGAIAPFAFTALSVAEVRNLVLDTPVGGHLLRDWVGRSFDQALVSGIKGEVATGGLPETLSELSDRVSSGFGVVERDATSLSHTYVQSVNVGAMEAVYRANREVVKGVRWTAVMEVGGSRGRGTCLSCAALDGQEFRPDEARPPCPLHINCRCLLVPSMKSWRELGLNSDEMLRTYSPWIRPSREVLAGFQQGDFASWFAGLSPADQLSVVGPGRHGLLSSGAVSFRDLVDRNTGRLRLLDKDASGRIVGLR